MVVIQDGDNILMKPIQKPARSEFSQLIKEGNRIRKESDLTREDITQVIKDVRKSRARRS